MVANRSVGTGLTASAVVSSWMYSTALLGSPYLTYWYGIALPVWWANGQSTMICMFAWLAIQAKRRVPNAHTLLELIRGRYGTVAHILWIILCLINNLLIFSSMLVGASAAVTAVTGMNLVAVTYLLPMGVAIYTYFGGTYALGRFIGWEYALIVLDILRHSCNVFDGLHTYLHHHDRPCVVLLGGIDNQGDRLHRRSLRRHRATGEDISCPRKLRRILPNHDKQ